MKQMGIGAQGPVGARGPIGAQGRPGGDPGLRGDTGDRGDAGEPVPNCTETGSCNTVHCEIPVYLWGGTARTSVKNTFLMSKPACDTLGGRTVGIQ